MTIQNNPVITLPTLNVSNLIITNDATTPNTKLNISLGTARDQNNVIDMTVGASNPNLEGSTVVAPLVLDATTNGANGLDTGTLAASKMYLVYLISDSRYYKPTASLLSLSTTPLLPTGYDSYRLIGYAPVDSSTHFYKGYNYGTGTSRYFSYDAPAATSISGGSSGTYAACNLVTLVPAVNNTPVYLKADFTANAAADILNLQGGASTGDQWTVVAPIAGATAHTITYGTVLAQIVTSNPTINYKVTAGTVSLYVSGFSYSI